MPDGHDLAMAQAVVQLPPLPLPPAEEYDAESELALLHDVVEALVPALRQVERGERDPVADVALLTALPVAGVVLSLRARALGPHGSSARAEQMEKIIAVLQPANEALIDLFCIGAPSSWEAAAAPVTGALLNLLFTPIMCVHNTMPMPYGLGRLWAPKQGVDAERVMSVTLPALLATFEDSAQHPVVRQGAMLAIGYACDLQTHLVALTRQIMVTSDTTVRCVAGLSPPHHPDIQITEQPWDPTATIFALFWDQVLFVTLHVRETGEETLLVEFARKCVEAGTLRFAVKLCRDFVGISDAATILPAFGCVLNLLETVGKADGGAQIGAHHAALPRPAPPCLALPCAATLRAHVQRANPTQPNLKHVISWMPI